MKTYKVTYKESFAHEFYIEAKSRTEAEREFYRQANIGKINFDNGKMYDSHLSIIEDKEV